jgi:probable H4MPT-linked C1 transfer pathway protein
VKVRVTGWDIGGANLKAAALEFERGGATSGRVARRPFEIWKDPGALCPMLRELHRELGPADAMAVTMTAELADVFRNKAEGVAFVLRALREAVPATPLYLVDRDGHLVRFDGELGDPVAYAATNWIAESLALAEFRPDCLLVDIGSTTTDLIPIVGGRLAARGRADSERLAWGELLYTGVLRTPVAAIASQVPIRGMLHRISAEHFAVAGDVYVALGRLVPEDYTCPTPDGRGRSPEDAMDRLARVVCEDGTTLVAHEILAMAACIAEEQAHRIIEGMLQVLSRFESGFRLPVVPAGIGAFLGAACARRLGLQVIEPPALASGESPGFSACAAAAYILGRALSGEGQHGGDV